MSAATTLRPGDLDAFADAIEARFGHQRDAGRAGDLAALLEARMLATSSRTYAAYAARLREAHAEWEALAPLLTVPETYFFRMPDHFEALVNCALPEVLKANKSTRTLRILSAGCATGEEAYTLRLVLNERLPQLAGWAVSITGVDLSEAALGRARAGLYSTWSLRATSEARRQANFTPFGKSFRLNDAGRAGVTFSRENLLAPPPAGEPPYDVIFCRNVLIYFSEEAIRQAVARLTERLAPRGYLFLGPAESLRGVTRDFTICRSNEVFFYRRETETGTPYKPPGTKLTEPIANASPAVTAQDASWYMAIENSSARLAALAVSAPVGKAAFNSQSGQENEASTTSDKAPAGFLELVRQEQFAEALALLEAQGNSPASALLRAVTLTNLGRQAEAEQQCHQLLSADPHDAGAHYLVGLCREQQADLDVAEQHLSMATFLDPTFSLAHLHRGLVAKRRKDSQAARVAFQHALRALDAEQEERLALFGGGFSREGLRQICLRETARFQTAASAGGTPRREAQP